MQIPTIRKACWPEGSICSTRTIPYFKDIIEKGPSYAVHTNEKKEFNSILLAGIVAGESTAP